MEVEEIDDVPVKDPVDQIADNSPAEQSEAHLNKGSTEGELPAEEEDAGQGDDREEGEPEALAGKETPGRPGVADMDDVEEAGDDDEVVGREIGVKGQVPVYPYLGYLIGRKDKDGDEEKPPVGGDAGSQTGKRG